MEAVSNPKFSPNQERNDMKKKQSTLNPAPFQQGDVLLFPGAVVPAGAERIKARQGKFVLAEGETTGHAHRVEAVDTADYWKAGDQTFLTLAEPATIEHEEHGHIELPAGNYEIRIVKEVDPFTDEIKAVQD